MSYNLAFACMRNEAIFLLEWVAYQLVVGFDRVAVVTNDCGDGTDHIVQRLARIDPRVFHIENVVPDGEAPHVSGIRTALAHPDIANATFVLHCDADEFLHVSVGNRKVADLLEHAGHGDCIALAWRPFGDSGIDRWEGGFVLDQFRMSDLKVRGHTVMHKSMFRPNKFGWANSHMPKGPKIDTPLLVNASGDEMNNRTLFQKSRGRFLGNEMALMNWNTACIHHYVVRSVDTFLLKNVRGSAMGVKGKYHINSKFWQRYNRNRVEVPEARQHLEAVREMVARFRADSEIRGLEEAAFDWFRRLRDTELTQERIAAWTD